MKFLKTYEGYKKSNFFGNELTTEEFNKLYKKNCKNHKNQKVKLYRGIQHKYENDLYVNPKGHIRSSIENENIHVILMSEMDSWKNFPKYNQSVIGTTMIKEAESYNHYGTLFEIIPFDNTKIGVCSQRNIWNSYGGYHSAYNIIRIVDNFLRSWINDYDSKSWEKIKKEILKKDIRENINNQDSSYFNTYAKDKKLFFETMMYKKEHDEFGYEYEYDNYKFYEKFIKIVEPTPEKIIEHIEWLFDPERSGFNSIKYDSNFSKNMNKFFDDYSENLQIWCEGPVLLKKVNDDKIGFKEDEENDGDYFNEI